MSDVSDPRDDIPTSTPTSTPTGEAGGDVAGDDALAGLADARGQRALRIAHLAEAGRGPQPEVPPPPLPEPDLLEPVYPSVEAWVAGVFARTYTRRATPEFRWCAQWWRHPEAIVRLEALWRSWEAQRYDPLLGMSTWLRDNLDHHLPLLTAAAGPFADCDPQEHWNGEGGEDPARLAVTEAPAGWWLVPTPPAS